MHSYFLSVPTSKAPVPLHNKYLTCTSTVEASPLHCLSWSSFREGLLGWVLPQAVSFLVILFYNKAMKVQAFLLGSSN